MTSCEMLNSFANLSYYSFNGIYEVDAKKDDCEISLKNKKLVFRTPYVSIISKHGSPLFVFLLSHRRVNYVILLILK